VGPGDATIIEAQWEYPGTYLFHSHGIQEEHGNMGLIMVAENCEHNNQSTADNETGRSISMFDWQYELQQKLQNPRIINYSDTELIGIHGNKNNNSNRIVHDNTTTFTKPTANVTATEISEHRLPHNNNIGNISSNLEISIVEGSANPSSEVFYDPSPATVKRGGTIIRTNNDSVPHTATSGNPDSGEAQTGTFFDTGILGPGQSSEETRINAEAGTYDYYCTLHPFMKGQLTITD
jgi:nitrite reductase (NO-forming)